MTERQRDMVEMYGEACSMIQAGRIINRSDETIRRMLHDGRLRTACEGSMVDVRSLADYIERPKQMDSEARTSRKREKAGVACRFKV